MLCTFWPYPLRRNHAKIYSVIIIIIMNNVNAMVTGLQLLLVVPSASSDSELILK
jgi:hypothetical protein